VPSSQDQYNSAAKVYDDLVIVTPWVIYMTDPLLWSGLGDTKGKSVLDLACGSGYYLKSFVEQGAKEITGADISQSMIDIAKASLGDNVKLIVEDMSKPDLYLIIGENKFDLILSAWGLYYMETENQLQDALRNVYKMLTPGGKCCFILADDKNIVDHGIGELLQVEVKAVVKGDWSGPTQIQKLLGKSFECFDTWRSPQMVQEAVKKAGFGNVKIEETLHDELGLKGWTSEDWSKIKAAKPIFMISAHKL